MYWQLLFVCVIGSPAQMKLQQLSPELMSLLLVFYKRNINPVCYRKVNNSSQVCYKFQIENQSVRSYLFALIGLLVMQKNNRSAS